MKEFVNGYIGAGSLHVSIDLSMLIDLVLGRLCVIESNGQTWSCISIIYNLHVAVDA